MSLNGIKTAFWGPHAWAFLFSSIAGSYPVKYDPSNKDHVKIVKGYQMMFNSLQYTLPCIFCRQSYSVFIKQLPITDYQGSRKDMLKWLYLIHDKVNLKLMHQERECFEVEKAKLKERNYSTTQFNVKLKSLKADIIKTKPSPPFEKVVAKYEQQRAGCSKKNKRCA